MKYPDRIRKPTLYPIELRARRNLSLADACCPDQEHNHKKPHPRGVGLKIIIEVERRSGFRCRWYSSTALHQHLEMSIHLGMQANFDQMLPSNLNGLRQLYFATIQL